MPRRNHGRSTGKKPCAKKIKKKNHRQLTEEGRAGQKRGKANELKFIAAYEEAKKLGKFPTWLKALRKATKIEDTKRKTDAVAITDVGPIRIQIKSSDRSCFEFMESRWGKFIICVAVYDDETLEALFNRTLPKIAGRRHKCIQKNSRPR